MADKHLFTFLLLSSYSIQAPECTFTRSANQERPCFHSKSWPGLLESCFQGQRHGGHPRRANNIVPFCLCKDREYSTILAMDDADFANLINFVPSQIQTAKRHQLLLVRQRILVRDGKTPWQGMQVLYIVCIYFNSLLELYIVLIKLCVNVYF